MTNAWLDISTAPKDGTDILLFFPDFNHKVQIGSYDITEHFRNGVSDYKNEGWSCASGFTSLFDGKDKQPSHWMPLPEYPVKS